MKTKFLSGIALLTIGLLMNGCDDDNDVIYIDPYYADAQEAIAVSLSYGTYGMVANMSQASTNIKDTADCGKAYISTDSIRVATPSGRWNYNYDYQENYSLACSDDRTVDYHLTAKEEFDILRSCDHAIELNYMVSVSADDGNDEMYNGTYKRTGEWESIHGKNRYKFTFDSQIENACLSGASGKIYKGIAKFKLTENYESSKLTRVYEGTVEFMNENNARVVLDNGSEFIVDMHNVSISSN